MGSGLATQGWRLKHNQQGDSLRQRSRVVTAAQGRLERRRAAPTVTGLGQQGCSNSGRVVHRNASETFASRSVSGGTGAADFSSFPGGSLIGCTAWGAARSNKCAFGPVRVWGQPLLASVAAARQGGGVFEQRRRCWRAAGGGHCTRSHGCRRCDASLQRNAVGCQLARCHAPHARTLPRNRRCC